MNIFYGRIKGIIWLTLQYDEIDKKIVAYTIAMVRDDASYTYDSTWNKNTDFNI